MMLLTLCMVSMTLVTLSQTQSNSDTICMRIPRATFECFRGFKGKPISSLSGKISCLQDLFWNFQEDRSFNEKDRILLRNISDSLGGMQPSALFAGAEQSQPARGNYMYPPSGYRKRKEYRMLTPEERYRFHRVLDRMYQDGYIETFAKMHNQAANIHHGGASFLPWHRILLLVFEEIMRQYDPRVSLPYWASAIDNNMDNPVNSILWKPEYFGNGNGAVMSGPAAGWVTDQGRLERAYGRFSTLFKHEQIDDVLTQCKLANISVPTASRRYNFELFHGGPHVWVGGDMSSIQKAAYDPIFYMHHAYVDYIWELFRHRQKRQCRVDPAYDYPEVTPGDRNHADAPMVGFEWFTNKDGLREQWTKNWYNYEREPSCPDCCPGCPHPAPLYCHRRRNVCIPRSTYVSGRAVPTAAMVHVIPRNRGTLFNSLPSDGRTIFTVDDDVRAFVLENGTANTTTI